MSPSSTSASTPSSHSVARKISGLLCTKQQAQVSANSQPVFTPKAPARSAVDLDRNDPNTFRVDLKSAHGAHSSKDGKGAPVRQSSTYSDGSSSSSGKSNTGLPDTSGAGLSNAEKAKQKAFVERHIIDPATFGNDDTPDTNLAHAMSKVNIGQTHTARLGSDKHTTALSPPPEHLRRKKSFLDVKERK